MIKLLLLLIIIYGLVTIFTNKILIQRNIVSLTKPKPKLNTKKVETFLDYSLVDKKKYPPIKTEQCPNMNGDLHISFYQRDSPEENSWLFGYPNYRNYIGGGGGTNGNK